MVSQIVQARLRVATPLFLRGAENEIRRQAGTGPDFLTEFRPPSILGALQFWWRANRGATDVEELRSRQTELFGSASAGLGMIRLDAWRATGKKEGLTAEIGPIDLGKGRGYLAGLGLGRIHGGTYSTERGFFRPGGRFVVRCVVSGSEDRVKVASRELSEAILAFATCGGLGARSRRGFGSIALESLACSSGGTLDEGQSLEGRAKRLASAHAGDPTPGHTAFSRDTRLILIRSKGSNVEELHESIGSRFQELRKQGSVLSKLDSRDILDWLDGNPLAAPPRRAVFGLPHNYHFPGRGELHIEPQSAKYGRRASPLMIHLEDEGSGDAVGSSALISFFPATFLPAGERIKLEMGSRSALVSPRVAADLWKPVHDWLDQLLKSGNQDTSIQQVFP
jgi:CRISPR-associated protein Cmr1